MHWKYIINQLTCVQGERFLMQSSGGKRSLVEYPFPQVENKGVRGSNLVNNVFFYIGIFGLLAICVTNQMRLILIITVLLFFAFPRAWRVRKRAAIRLWLAYKTPSNVDINITLYHTAQNSNETPHAITMTCTTNSMPIKSGFQRGHHEIDQTRSSLLAPCNI